MRRARRTLLFNGRVESCRSGIGSERARNGVEWRVVGAVDGGGRYKVEFSLRFLVVD
jgi:hypothetical protein